MQNEELLEKNLQIMEVVEKELNHRKTESTFCFSIFLAATCVWVMLVKLWEMLGEPIRASSMTYGVEIIAIIMLVVSQTQTKMKLSSLGFSTKGLAGTMKRAGIICAVIVVIMFAVKLIIRNDGPLFTWSRYNFLYPVTSILQEFLARGFLVTLLLNLYDTKYKKHLAIVLSSLLFTALHLHYGFMFMVGSGILSVILGYVYVRDRNIWGVSLIHFVFGAVGSILTLA